MKLARLTLLFFLFPLTAHAENYFHWDCESKTSASHAFYEYVGSRTTLSSEQAYSGKKSLKFTAVGNDQGNQAEGVEFSAWDLGSLVSGKELYYRWWMLIDKDFSFGNGTAKLKASRAKDSDEQISPAWTGYIEKEAIDIGECWGCSPGGEDPSNAIVSHNFQAEAGSGWHEWIVKMKLQSSYASCNGAYEVFRDGRSLGSVSGMCYGTDAWKGRTLAEAWSGWMIRPYFQLNGRESDGGDIFVDDFSVDNVWNSSFDSGSNPPAPPTTTTTSTTTSTSTTLPAPVEPPNCEEAKDAIIECTKACWWRGCARKCFKQKGLWRNNQ